MHRADRNPSHRPTPRPYRYVVTRSGPRGVVVRRLTGRVKRRQTPEERPEGDHVAPMKMFRGRPEPDAVNRGRTSAAGARNTRLKARKKCSGAMSAKTGTPKGEYHGRSTELRSRQGMGGTSLGNISLCAFIGERRPPKPRTARG